MLGDDLLLGIGARKGYAHLFAGQRRPGVGLGGDGGDDRLIRPVAVLLRREAQAEGVPVGGHAEAALDRLPAGIRDLGLEGVDGVLAQLVVGGEGGGPAAGGIGDALEFGDLLAVGRLPLVPPVGRAAVDLEDHVGAGHRLAEEVVGLDGNGDVVAGHDVGGG